METNDALLALAALAQATRLAIFRLLVQQGPEGVAAGGIAEALTLPNATLSFHLKEMANAGLIYPRQESRFIYYVANYEAMNGLIGYLTKNCCGGKACVPAARQAVKHRRSA